MRNQERITLCQKHLLGIQAMTLKITWRKCLRRRSARERQRMVEAVQVHKQNHSENKIIHPCKNMSCVRKLIHESQLSKTETGRSIEYIIFMKECQIYVRSLVPVWVYCLHYSLMHNKYSLQLTFMFCPFQMEHAWSEKKIYLSMLPI